MTEQHLKNIDRLLHGMKTGMMNEKWVVKYDEQDGRESLRVCNDIDELPRIIRYIRVIGGRNVVITDQTPWCINREDE